MANNISELDFDKIKTNLKTHLKSQSRFSDYDFDGSSMNVILDVLAYTTHYMGVHANMAFSERFLDSAQIRSSVVSIAKEIGYFPRQRQAAKATVNIQIMNPAGSPASIIIPKGKEFVASNTLGDSYPFVTPIDYSLVDTGAGNYNVDIDISQGVFETFRFDFDINNPLPFIIEQKGIDTDFISVSVKASSLANDSTATKFTHNTNITTIKPTSNVFFLEETSDGKVEVYFGDGVLGASIADGNQVIVEYLSTAGPDANSSDGFALTSGIGSYALGLFNLTTVAKAFGGSLEESIQSIKNIAPKIYKAQGRAVTADDYRAILLDHFGWIESMNVWGGEDNVPQQFGKVILSIKPDYGNTLTQPVKDEVLTYLDKFRIVGITPSIIDPNYIYVNVDSKFKYNSQLTDKTQVQLEAIVGLDITNFFAVDVKTNFDSTMSYSKLLAAIDGADKSIVSNETKTTLSKKFVPNTLNFFTYEFDFANALVPGTFRSKDFVSDITTYYFQDDGNGNVNLYDAGVIVPSEQNKHKIDYATGLVKLLSWKANSLIGASIELEVTPVSQDIIAKRNVLIVEGTPSITSTLLV